MATVNIVKRVHFPAGRATVADVTFSNSYLTGGEALSATDLGLLFTVDLCLAAPAGGLLFEFDHSAKKLKVLYPTGGATAAPAALADPKVTTGAASATAVDATTPNITPGRGKEVLATTDLSAITCRVLAIGDSVGLTV